MSPVSLLKEASLLSDTSHQSNIQCSGMEGRGLGSKEANLINSSLGFWVNFSLPVVSVIQGNLNSDTTVFEPDFSWRKILHPSHSLSLDTGDRNNYYGVLVSALQSLVSVAANLVGAPVMSALTVSL